MDYSRSLRRHLMAFTACGVVASLAPAAMAQETGGVAPTAAQAPGSTASRTEEIAVRQHKRLVAERNSPSAVTELGERQIASVGVSGSPASLLRQAPSVNVYQQSIGDSAPTITVRGLRGLEIATTLDGVPTQDLEAPGSFYLSNNIGAVFTLNQISGVSIYPGVAYPNRSTFGTIGGTIAYDTKRPTDEHYLDLSGSVGSFGTNKFSVEGNSGRIDTALGTGDNALKVLVNYTNFQTNGFIDFTQNRENELEFALDKPYNDGLSKFQATVIYNDAKGLIQNEPVPVPYLQQNGFFSNYPSNLNFVRQNNDNLLLILKDDNYINDIVPELGVTAFYLANDQQTEDYGDVNLITANGAPGALTVGGSSPFINSPGGFGEGYLYGPPIGGGLLAGGVGGYFFDPKAPYNPSALYPPGSKYCPLSLSNQYPANTSPCGLNDQITGSHSDTYGIKPHAIVVLPTVFGITNTIDFGGLAAKETTPEGFGYLGGGPNTPMNPQNQYIFRNGGTERTIFQGYVQDRIDLLQGLHITPGVTVEGTYSSLVGSDIFGSTQAPAYGPNGIFNGGTDVNQYGPYKAYKWDREILPFFNISYDFDHIYPPLAGLRVYASTGQSALFAPVGDFGPNTAGPPPYASIVHLYEGGVQYDTSKLAVSATYFYQKVDRDFGFFSFQSGPQAGLSSYNTLGAREIKGVEASVQYNLMPNLQLFANGSHMLAKYLVSDFAFTTVAQDQYGFATKGTPVTGIPDFLSTFGVDYSRKSTLVDGDAFDARLTGQYTGHQYTTYDLSGSAYLDPSIQFNGLLPLDFSGCPGSSPALKGAGTCQAYTRYNQITGATVYDPNGGISPFAVFNLDMNYKLPTPQMPALKSLTFDLNVQNLFDERFYQYFYKQVSPGNCGTFTSGPFVGLTKNNYSCSPVFADAIPGQPFSVFFTVTARFQ